ncbi:hypothetical protein [Martelella radicis]|uniref:Uncharacterized protein n=1 Tax=Martelella radicis TaxID=1397476 RepID=A0A7W6KKD1_9HYPH|nr:hypothetical protein [Martelella radicis]MBB4122901.1 hypothetical protein [Martelella radicis]
MHDHFLKFADHAEALSVLETIGVTIPVGEIGYLDAGLPEGLLALKPVGAACDGLVYAPTGETATDGEGFDYPLMDAVEGFHVNLRMADGAALPAALVDFAVAPEPATPAERFA